MLVGDLSRISEIKRLAEDAKKLGSFDVLIHNAGLYRGGFQKTEDGFPALIAINTFAPYILSCLVPASKKLVWVSSGLHNGGSAALEDIGYQKRGEGAWSDSQGYADSKLHIVMLAKAFARRFPGVESNALDPGWVATKMGGASATGDIEKAADTYVLLADGDSGTGKYYFDSKAREPTSAANDEKLQDQLLEELAKLTGVKVPSSPAAERSEL